MSSSFRQTTVAAEAVGPNNTLHEGEGKAAHALLCDYRNDGRKPLGKVKRENGI